MEEFCAGMWGAAMVGEGWEDETPTSGIATNPELIAALEDDGCQRSEYAVSIDAGFDLDAVVSERKAVVGVGLMAHTMGNRRAGLHCDDAAFRGRIVRVGVADISVVKMAREEDVYACCDQNGDGESGTPDEFDADPIGRWDEGVVGDDQFQAGAGIVKTGLQHLKLVGGNATVLPGEGAGGVEACDDQLVVAVNRIDVGGDEPAVSSERRQESAEDVEEGDIVVAGNHQLRAGQAGEEVARLGELGAAGALGEIAADDR